MAVVEKEITFLFLRLRDADTKISKDFLGILGMPFLSLWPAYRAVHTLCKGRHYEVNSGIY